MIVSAFIGGITDGHGQHQVSGEIAQEVFKAAPDASVFPDQLKPVSEGGLGLQPWQPLAVYSENTVCAGDEQGDVRLRDGKVVSGTVPQLHHGRVVDDRSLRR